MPNKLIVLVAASAFTLATPLMTSAQETQTQQNPSSQMGDQMGGKKGGMMGGMMGKKGHQGGMMRQMQKMHKNMMAKHFVARQKAFSQNDIKRIIDGRLASNGFSRLKVGEVKEDGKDNDNFTVVDVVSGSGEYLFRLRVNRQNGKAMIVD